MFVPARYSRPSQSYGIIQTLPFGSSWHPILPFLKTGSSLATYISPVSGFTTTRPSSSSTPQNFPFGSRQVMSRRAQDSNGWPAG